MKKREGFWFTVISYIVENWLLPGYHLSRNPPKGAVRKKKEMAMGDIAKPGIERLFPEMYPKAGE